MGGAVVNKAAFFKALDRAETAMVTLFRSRVRLTVSEAMRRLLKRTPVHTGQAVESYVASAGAPYSGPVKQGFDVVEATNTLPLGSEKNRPAAEAVAFATLQNLDFTDPFQVYHITNNSPQIAGLEAGELPHTPYKPRSPAGMFGVTNQELIMLLQSGKI